MAARKSGKWQIGKNRNRKDRREESKNRLRRRQAAASAKKKEMQDKLKQEAMAEALAELSKKGITEHEKKQEAKKKLEAKKAQEWVALKAAAVDRRRRRLRPKPGDDLLLSD